MMFKFIFHYLKSSKQNQEVAVKLLSAKKYLLVSVQDEQEKEIDSTFTDKEIQRSGNAIYFKI